MQSVAVGRNRSQVTDINETLDSRDSAVRQRDSRSRLSACVVKTFLNPSVQ